MHLLRNTLLSADHLDKKFLAPQRIHSTIQDLMVATGRNIMKLRKAAGLSVREMQNIFGFTTPQAIYKWQHGTAMPTIDNLVVLAAVLDVTIDEILVVQREDIVQFAT